MEPKRELASVDLRALVGELGAYKGAIVDKAYLYGDDLLRLRLRDHDRGRVELLIEVGEQKRIHVSDPDLVPDAPERPPNFAKMIRNRMSGATFEGVEQHGFDRILKLDFERTDADTSIVAELFGDGNVAVLDENGSVVDCLETVRLHSRTVAPGSQYEYPEARVDPLSLSYDAFVELMEASDTDVVRTLATQLDLGGEYAEELCARAGVEKELSIAEADEDVYEPVYDAIQWLADALESADLDPRVYYANEEDGGANDEGAADADDNPADADEETAAGENGDDANGGGDTDESERGQPVDVTPVPLADHAALASEPHDTFNAAVDAYFHELAAFDAGEATEGSGEPDRPDFEGEIEKQERIIAQQEEAIQGFEQEAQSLRAAAEALYARYDLVDELLRTVRAAREEGHDWDAVEERLSEGADRGIEAAEIVDDVDPQNARIRVELETEGDDEADSETHTAWIEAEEGVEHNADRLYTEAKEIEEKKAGAESAIEDTRERLAEIEQRREEWQERDQQEDEDSTAEEGEEGEEDDGRSDQEWLDMPSIPIRSRDWWYDRFRWVRTSQDFLVIGGRDADQNEELVQKYLEPGDRFLHAQAHGGPVTILKAADPSESGRDVEIPEAAEREAARFAVTYSSVWKEGKFAGDVYAVDHDQVSKTPESGEYLEKGGFAIRGDRTYYDDVEVACSVGIQCEPETRVIGGPPEAIADRAVTTVAVEPGKFAQGDVGKRIYREFRDRFADTSFVRKVASPDLIQHFLPPGTSRIAEE
jgi:predicted ribosome quality control (RQC) complex YloA/Tae2 family protein